MNVFDRNINFDSLFKFSQMYVSMQSIPISVTYSTYILDYATQVSSAPSLL